MEAATSNLYVSTCARPCDSGCSQGLHVVCLGLHLVNLILDQGSTAAQIDLGVVSVRTYGRLERANNSYCSFEKKYLLLFSVP